jgi:hypothetical protein
LWNNDGTPAFTNAAAQSILKNPQGMALRPAVGELLTTWTFPLKDLPDFPAEARLTEPEIRLVLSTFKPLLDDASKLYGVILIPDR